MKNIDSFDGFEIRALFSTELTCVPPLWNHPKTVGVAQAILPVRFRNHGDFYQVTFVEAIS